NAKFRVVYGDEDNDYVESKESPSAVANLYQKWNGILLFGLQLQQIKDIREMKQVNYSLKPYSLLSESGQRNRSKKGATVFYQVAQEQIKTVFHNNDV
ncbi:4090_t:CDS:2, partial [Scutellospora calospora]